MESGSTKKRIEYLDVAKGIAMVCVIVSHLGDIPNLLSRVCFSFHMPLFFLLSGYFFRKEDGNLLIKRKARQLLKPYTITSVLVIISSIFWNGILKNESVTVGRNMLEWLWAFFYGSGNTFDSPYWIKQIGAIWFLPALFFALILLRFCLNQKYSFLWIVLLMWVGCDALDVLWLPFSILASLAALGYLYIGYKMKEYHILEQLIASPIIVGTAFLLWVFYLFCGGGNLYIGRAYFANGLYYETFFSSVATFCVIWIAYILSKKPNPVERFLKFVGQNSLMILCLHLIELNTFPWWLLTNRFAAWGGGHGLVITMLFCLKLMFAVTITAGWKQWKVIMDRRRAGQDRDNLLLIKTADHSESWISFAYTFVMLLLILGSLELDERIRAIIFSIHMPLFMILLGYCYEKRSIKEIVLKDLKPLFIIYIGVGCCNLFVSIWKELFYHAGNIETISAITKQWFSTVLGGISLSSKTLENLDGIGFVWIIPPLMFGYLCLTMVLKLKNTVVRFCVVIVSTLFGVYWGKEIGILPYRIDIPLMFALLLYVGYCVKKYGLLNKMTTYKSYIPLMLIWGIGLWNGRKEFGAGHYPDGFFSIISAIAGAMFVIQMIRELEKVNPFQGICRVVEGNLFLILGIHSLDLQLCDWTPILEGRSLTLQLLIKGLLYFSLFILFIVMKEWIRTGIEKIRHNKTVMDQTDTALFISILCIIIGHAVSWGTPIRNFLFSFQMPLFFILMGWRGKRVHSLSEFREQIKTDFISLIIPYLMFYVADSLLGILFYGETVNFVVWVEKLIWASGVAWNDHPAIGVLWMINVLFWAKVIFSVIQLIIPERFRGMACIGIAVVGYMLGVQQKWLILSLDVAMVVVFYLYIGSKIHEILNLIEKHRLWLLAVFGLWLFLWNRGLYIEFAPRHYPSFALTLIESLCGSVCVVVFARRLDQYLERSGPGYGMEQYTMMMLGIHHVSGRFAQLWGRGVFYDCLYSLMFVFSATAFVIFAKRWLGTSSERRERAYLAVLSLYMIRVFFHTILLTFPWPRHFDTLLRIAAVIIVGAGLSEHKWRDDKRLFIFIAVGTAFILSCFSNGYLFLADLALFIIGAVDIPYKKILKSYCICGIVMMGLAVSSALTGAVEDLIYSGGRHSFGVVYPTDFAAHVVFLLLAVWVAFRKIPAKGMAVVMGGSSFFLYHYCRARCGAIVMGLSAIAVLLVERIEWREMSGKPTGKMVKALDWLMIFWMPLCAAAMIGMSVNYSSGDARLEAINRWISSRLYLAHNAIDRYGIKAFGTAFEMIGGGNDTVSRAGYNFVDSSYCMILLQYGAVILAVIGILYMWTTKGAMRARNHRISMAMALIAVHSVIEHHLTDLAYNPFLLLAFADLAHTGGHHHEGKGESKGKGDYFIWPMYGVAAILAMAASPKMFCYARTIVTLLRLNEPSRNLWYILGVLVISFIGMMGVKKIVGLVTACIGRQKPDRRTAAACVLYIIAGVGAAMAFEAALKEKSETYAETLERGTQVIKRIRESGGIGQDEIKICVDDIPELYERAAGGITNPVLTGASLASQSDIVLLTNIEHDRYTLTDSGFLFGELSEQQGIYVKSEEAAKAIENFGIPLQDHYRVRKAVDLDAMAGFNDLEFGVDGGLMIRGPEHSLIHGPWVTVYRGRILVEYRIKFIGSEIASGEVAKVRLSAEAGKSVLQEKPINREDFGEDGFCVVTMEEWIESKEGVEFLLFAHDGTELEVVEITYGKTGR